MGIYMSDKTKKILLLNYHSEETEQAINLFQHFHVTTAESLKDIAEKGKDDFDIVITGYVVPAVSDEFPFSYLEDIDTAIKKLESEIRTNKTEEVIETEFREKQEHILQRLNDAIEAREKEMQEADSKIAAELAEKTAIINKLTGDISILNEQLEAAQENVQRVQIEHKKTLTKLEKLQETWENYKNA